MTFEALMKELKAGKYKPVYLLQGEEDYFIDQACHFFEFGLLSEAERDFNLSVFYGKDAEWSDVINACRRYPMFSERQVVILKEAQSMKKSDFERLESYLEDLMDTTIFVITYKRGKIDGRSKLSKLLTKKGTVMLVQKLYENQLPAWIRSYTQSKGYDITDKACMLLSGHIGMDLSVQANEIGKIIINLPEGSKIDDAAVEKFVGISREYNVFEFQNALGVRDIPRIMRIIQYFEGNPKAAPLALLLPVLYNFFSKTVLLLRLPKKSSGEMASALGVSPFFLKDYQQAAKAYQLQGAEKALLLLHEYNLRMLGINNAGTSQSELLKEMTARILYN